MGVRKIDLEKNPVEKNELPKKMGWRVPGAKDMFSVAERSFWTCSEQEARINTLRTAV